MDNNKIASLRSQLVMLTKYNLWANTKISEFLLKLDPALLDKELHQQLQNYPGNPVPRMGFGNYMVYQAERNIVFKLAKRKLYWR